MTFPLQPSVPPSLPPPSTLHPRSVAAMPLPPLQTGHGGGATQRERAMAGRARARPALTPARGNSRRAPWAARCHFQQRALAVPVARWLPWTRGARAAWAAMAVEAPHGHGHSSVLASTY